MASLLGVMPKPSLRIRAHLSWHNLLHLTADPYFTLIETGFSSQIQYSAASKDNLQNYSLVTDTPVYVTAVQSGINASEVRLACLLFQNEPSFVVTSFQPQKRITHLSLSVGEI